MKLCENVRFVTVFIISVLIVIGLCVHAWIFYQVPEEAEETTAQRANELKVVKTANPNVVKIGEQLIDLKAELRYIPDETIPEETTAEPTQNIQNYYDIPLDHETQDFMFQECSRYNIPSSLIVAIMETESGFRADVISKTNDYGLMQINACNHEWLSNALGVTNFLDAKQNILCGIYILKLHLDYCNGDIRKALVCYARGQGGAQKLFDQGIFETDYTKDLLERAEKWESDLGI